MLRLGIIPVSLGAMLMLRSKIGARAPDIPVVIVPIYIAIFHAYLVTQTGYADSRYFHSYVQILLAISVVPFSQLIFFLALISVAAIYIVAVLSGSSSHIDFLIHGDAVFLKTYVIMTCFLYYSIRYARRLGYLSQMRLENDVEDREKTIQTLVEEKVKIREAEATYRLAAQVAHDIRSPVSALNMLSASLDGVSDDRRLILKNATQRINDIANSLLSKGQMVELAAQMARPVKIVPIIQAIVTEKGIQHPGQQIVFESLASNDGIAVRISSAEFARAVSNLVNNALDAINNMGRVLIEVESCRALVLVRIIDNGCGIESSALDKLGVRGFSFGKSGSGLGLHHAKKTVEDAGGSISIESELGQGTRITLRLPIFDHVTQPREAPRSAMDKSN